MNSLERKLIELNEALLKLATGQKPNMKLLSQAQHAVAGAPFYIDSGPGNDTIIINSEIDDNCNNTQCIQGIQGTQGIQGAQGIQGIQGIQGQQGIQGIDGESCDSCNTECILVSDDYQATCNDYYIGVNSNGPVTITLPVECEDCCEIIVKAEMGPPLGNRKVTITTSDGALIDGSTKVEMTVPYESVHLICRGFDWHVI